MQRIAYCKVLKGGIILSSTGYIQVHVYTSSARIPLKDTAVAITDADGAAIALRLTNQSGMFDTPVAIPVPNLSAGQTPDTGIIPYTVVNLYAKLEDYQEIDIQNLQVFPDVITNQNLEMIPLPEFPASWSQTEVFDTTSQNL